VFICEIAYYLGSFIYICKTQYWLIHCIFAEIDLCFCKLLSVCLQVEFSFAKQIEFVSELSFSLQSKIEFVFKMLLAHNSLF